MYYGIYKNIRDASWLCLNDFKISTLPVDIISLARAAGIRIIKNSDVGILEGDENGRAISINEGWTVIYNDALSAPAARYTIAHELGHIFLGHDTARIKYADIQSFNNTKAAEDQADSFAARLLCPACVIWALGLNSPEDIARYCGVELLLAQSRYDRIKLLNKRGKYLTSPLERKVFERFGEYINAELAKKEPPTHP